MGRAVGFPVGIAVDCSVGKDVGEVGADVGFKMHSFVGYKNIPTGQDIQPSRMYLSVSFNTALEVTSECNCPFKNEVPAPTSVVRPNNA